MAIKLVAKYKGKEYPFELPQKLHDEIQQCKLCRTARLLLVLCCPDHANNIKEYAENYLTEVIPASEIAQPCH